MITELLILAAIAVLGLVIFTIGRRILPEWRETMVRWERENETWDDGDHRESRSATTSANRSVGCFNDCMRTAAWDADHQAVCVLACKNI